MLTSASVSIKLEEQTNLHCFLERFKKAELLKKHFKIIIKKKLFSRFEHIKWEQPSLLEAWLQVFEGKIKERKG